MFTPDATGFISSARNPRRRHRSSGEDYLVANQSTKRRKRSSITSNTSEPLPSAKVNGHLPVVNGDHAQKEQIPEPEIYQNGNVEKPSSLAVRSRPSRTSREKRQSRHGEGVVLVSRCITMPKTQKILISMLDKKRSLPRHERKQHSR